MRWLTSLRRWAAKRILGSLSLVEVGPVLHSLHVWNRIRSKLEAKGVLFFTGPQSIIRRHPYVTASGFYVKGTVFTDRGLPSKSRLRDPNEPYEEKAG